MYFYTDRSDPGARDIHNLFLPLMWSHHVALGVILMWVEVKLMESYTERAWYIVVYCSIALKCLARFSALPAAAALPGTDAMVYPVLRSLMLSHSMVCSGSLAAHFSY